MRMVDLIEKKQNAEELTQQEIEWIVAEFTAGRIPDYQMSALAMAIYFQDMTDEERANLTWAMAISGDRIDLSGIHGVKVDKHSTGGVGDTTTLVLAPLVASVGVPVAKMSGRGLGHTGGTIDKLESIPGFKTELDLQQFMELVNRQHVAVIGQSQNLTPADKKLYALRDVTGTVRSIPLISSSIMSKKIAAGADAIVLDVKVGDGAFMKTIEDAEKLAHAMVKIGNQVGRKTMAVISDMSQPLGVAVGNALEVWEAIETLRGNGPEDLMELCLVLGSQMVLLAGRAHTLEEARQLLVNAIETGQALEKFKEFIASQGGDPAVVEDRTLMPVAAHVTELPSRAEGMVSAFDCEQIGIAAMMLGAGRATKESSIDLAVGLEILKKIGDPVAIGEPLVRIHSSTEDTKMVQDKLYEAIHIGEQYVQVPLIHRIITE